MHQRLDVGVEVDTRGHGGFGLRADIRQIEQAIAGERRFELVREHSCHGLGNNGVIGVGGIRIRTEGVVRSHRIELLAEIDPIRGEPGIGERRERDLVQVKVVATEVLHHPFLAIVEPLAAALSWYQPREKLRDEHVVADDRDAVRVAADLHLVDDFLFCGVDDRDCALGEVGHVEPRAGERAASRLRADSEFRGLLEPDSRSTRRPRPCR